ncbi:MAG: prepilin-type N-terminal cleavage/methylation domain-containing protein [Candidatus Peribacteria bacterium]|jgi:prepilin-type N-terminal cleavage/methylation domain-containing protein|nr:prepilin-type N-terminal cleavage/methylation domain-containing protein [Candidatus Peribacteria bacterium]
METLILKKSKKKQAFTLVELLVSVTIVILIS